MVERACFFKSKQVSYKQRRKRFFDVQSISVFRGQYQTYWHIGFGEGIERDYLQNELTISESRLTDSQARNVLGYLKQIANLSD